MLVSLYKKKTLVM